MDSPENSANIEKIIAITLLTREGKPPPVALTGTHWRNHVGHLVLVTMSEAPMLLKVELIHEDQLFTIQRKNLSLASSRCREQAKT